MPALAVEGARNVSIGANDLSQLVAFDHADVRVIETAMKSIHFFAQLAFLPRLQRDVHLTCDEIAVDGMARDQLALQAQALDRDVPDAPRVSFADQALEFALTTGHPGDGLRPTAARGTPADALGLEQHNAVAALGEMQRRGAACDAAPHDTHVCRVLTLQGGPWRLVAGRGGVPGVNVTGWAQIAPMYQSTSSGVTCEWNSSSSLCLTVSYRRQKGLPK